TRAGHRSGENRCRIEVSGAGNNSRKRFGSAAGQRTRGAAARVVRGFGQMKISHAKYRLFIGLEAAAALAVDPELRNKGLGLAHLARPPLRRAGAFENSGRVGEGYDMAGHDWHSSIVSGVTMAPIVLFPPLVRTTASFVLHKLCCPVAPGVTGIAMTT